MEAADSVGIGEIAGIVGDLRQAFERGASKTLAWRRQQLGQLKALVIENREAIIQAIRADLGSVPTIANMTETGPVVQELDLVLANLEKWMAPEKAGIPATLQPGQGMIIKEPFGVALIIAPWNYPFRLAILPLVGAIAAGNAALVKPSEVTKNTSNLMRELMDKYLDRSLVRCVEGGVPLTTELLRQKFDYIFYTGNTAVGKIVMRAAAENLTPVTLELGGKSPVVVAEDANIEVAARRIMYGKTLNVGQTCVAPDYVLVAESKRKALIKALKANTDEFFGPSAKDSSSYSRIVNERHTRRLQSMVEEVSDKVVKGGKIDVEGRFVEPTIVDNPPVTAKIMQEEIFGPLLPVLSVKDVDEAIRFVNSRPKPLALYVFSGSQATTDHVINNTSSGGVGRNATIFQIASPEMAFGGVGESGIGGYNGKFTFDTFSHKKHVLSKPTWLDPKVLYPPYTSDKVKAINAVADGLHIPKAAYLIPAVVGMALIARRARL